MFHPLSLVTHAQKSDITSVFRIQRCAMFEVEHLHEVKPHPFLLIDVMVTNQTLSERRNYSDEIV